MLLPALLSVLLVPAALAAESAQDHSIDLELFRPAPDGYGYFHTQSGATLGHLQVGTGFWFNYSDDPLVLVLNGDRISPTNAPSDSNDGDGVVDNRSVGNFHVGFGLSRFFSLTADIPLVLSQDGYQLDSIDNPTKAPKELTNSGLSDVKLQPKVVVVDRDYLPFGLSLAMPVSLPTGNGGSFLGEEGWTFTPTVIGEFSDASIRSRAYKFRTALNLGYMAREKARLRDVSVNNAFVYGLGVGYHPVKPLELVLDLHGQSFGGGGSQAPGELLLGTRFLIGRYVAVSLGGGKGLFNGIGAPDLRVFGGLSVAPSFDPNSRDSDKDRIVDGMDRCPKDAEDMDGYQDEDGCPDADNDADGIPDQVDKCANDPEDDDGHMDNDGCPDPDNDKDGIADVADRCPNEAESMNGYQDEDGCPDDKPIEDTDGDGYKDDVDRCPYDAEDFDQFEDEDGCPDTDNDSDGIIDTQDRCPNDREVINGFQDDDGCPDESQRVVVTEEAIEINESIYFDTGKATIQDRSMGLIDEIASVIQAHPELKRIRVEGHTDSVSDDVYNLKLSQSRADAVKAALVQRGVDAARLDAVGFGEMRPIDTNDTEEGRQKNRRVEFIIVKREIKKVIEK